MSMFKERATARACGLGAALCLVGIPFAHASYPNRAVRAVANQLAFGFGRIHQNYQEFHNGLKPGIGNVLDREDGSIDLATCRLSLLYDRFFGDLQLNYATGETLYDGHLQSGAPAIATTHNEIRALRADLGYALWTNSDGLLAPVFELGTRTWTRRITDTGQEERYKHKFLGLGLRGYYAITGDVVFSGLAIVGKTLSPVIAGTQVALWPAASLGTSTYKRAALGIEFRLEHNWLIGVAGEYLIWRYGQSGSFAVTDSTGTPAGQGIEPESRTAQTSYYMTVGHTF